MPAEAPLSSGASRSYSREAPYATEPIAASSTTAQSRRPNFQYDLSDIEKAHSISYVSRLHQEARSPLDPVYKLPKFIERPITPPRFVRDSLSVQDIERTRPKDPYAGLATRPQSSLVCEDINGARPKERYRKHVRTNSSLIAKDITHTKFVSQRHSNPLDPHYIVGASSLYDSFILGTRNDSEEKSNVLRLGTPDGSKPRRAPVGRSVDGDLSLRTHDIISKEAKEWSWTKPARTLVRTIHTQDVPGAQPYADRPRMEKTKRHTDPNVRDYGLGLGGRLVHDQQGMVHVHRHILDETPYAEKWKPAFGEPAADAAGVSLWRTGNFTAGTQPPRVPHQQQQPRKVAFGAPAEDTSIPEPAPVHQRQRSTEQPQQQQRDEPVRQSQPEKQQQQHVRASTPPVAVSEATVTAATATTAATEPSENLSYPPDTRKAPYQQKRHKVGSTYTPSELLSHPPSNGKEFVVASPATRVPTMVFGVRGPYSVPTEKASIEQTQTAVTVSGAATHPPSRTASRGGSRPLSGTGMNVASAATENLVATQKKSMASYTPTASILSNAFSLAFVPTSTTTLPHTLPFSSPVSRPGLGTVELFERKPLQGAAGTGATHSWARTQERKAATLKASEIQAVRALG